MSTAAGCPRIRNAGLGGIAGVLQTRTKKSVGGVGGFLDAPGPVSHCSAVEGPCQLQELGGCWVGRKEVQYGGGSLDMGRPHGGGGARGPEGSSELLSGCMP